MANLFERPNSPEFHRLVELDKKRSHSIAMANDVIDNMRMGMTAKQQDVLDFMLSLIKKGDDKDTVYTFRVKDYCDTMNIEYRKNGTNDKDIKAAVKSLKGACKWITVDNNGDGALISWFCGERYIAKTNSIQFRIDESIAPYLFDLVGEGHFTKYELRQIAALRSKHSKALYRILIRYLNTGINNPLIPIDTLREQLAVDSYDTYKEFKRWVLNVAEKEINELTFLKMEWDRHKAVGSRAITHISFKLEQLNPCDNGEGTRRHWNLVNKYGEDNLYDCVSVIPIKLV